MPLLSVQLQQTILSIGYVGLLICTSFYLLSFTRQRGLRIGQKATFFWLVFDALIHFFLEGPFVYYSTGGRTVNTSTGFFATVWKEYSHADARWGVADPNIVAVEILTVVLTGLLAMYAAWLVLHNRPQYHFWICFLCIAELYGDYMTFVPEILAGSPSLDTGNPLHLWFYLVISNGVWVIVPFCLLVHSGCTLISMSDPTPPPLPPKKAL